MSNVRRASASDLDAIVAIGKEFPWDKTAYLERQLGYGNIYVATLDERIMGFIVWNREFASLPCIWLCIVTLPFRGQGVGSQLFASVEDECKGSRLYSSTNTSNARMRAFFKKRGYREVGEVDIDPGDVEIFVRLSE